MNHQAHGTDQRLTAYIDTRTIIRKREGYEILPGTRMSMTLRITPTLSAPLDTYEWVAFQCPS